MKNYKKSKETIYQTRARSSKGIFKITNLREASLYTQMESTILEN